MPRLLPFFLACLLSITTASSAGQDWAGVWETNWREGGGRLIFEQKGDLVTGRYGLYDGRFEGTVSGSKLDGRWFEGDRVDEFELVLSHDKRTFAGSADLHGWLTGRRTNEQGVAPTIGLSTPREAWMNFVRACNIGRCGISDSWAIAVRAAEFESPAAKENRVEQLRQVREFFDVIDLTTFQLSDVLDEAPSGSLSVRLVQSRSDATLIVAIRRNDAGEWDIVVPNEEDLITARKSLLARYGENPPSPKSYQLLQNPRDTMRAFLDGMFNWDRRGKALALSTLDLSAFPDSLRASDSGLVAAYLGRVFDRVGFIGLQSIPNDGVVLDPYVHFVHPVGSVVIAPTGHEPGAPWKFTTETVEAIPDIYFVVADLPPAVESHPDILAPMAYFEIRKFVEENAPFLMGRVARFEFWQVLALLICLPTTLVLSKLVSRVCCWALASISWMPKTQPTWFGWAVALLFFTLTIQRVPHLIGVPERSREFSVPIVGSVVIIAYAGVCWSLVSIGGGLLVSRAQRTAGSSDDLVVNLLLACARLAIIVSAALTIAYLFSIPTSNILAGLGIGGLAVAFASRETLSNVFGAGILVADRPFRSGDWISSKYAEGFVEGVGIRSTRVRTAQDSIIVIPNGNLADATINNLGTRRSRLMVLQLAVTKGATPERLEAFITAIRARAAGDASIIADRTDIGVNSMDGASIQIQFTSYLNVKSDSAEIATRHAFLLDLMRIAAENGLQLGKGMFRNGDKNSAGGDDGE